MSIIFDSNNNNMQSQSCFTVDIFDDNIHINGSELTIHVAKRHQGGIYCCIATQEIEYTSMNHQEINFQVDILYPPTFETLDETITKSIGEIFTLTCKVDSSLEVIFVWMHDGIPIINQNIINFNFQSRLTLHIKFKKQFGIYTCRAFSENGSSFKNFHVRNSDKLSTC